MRFPNAAKGIKRIYNAEILKLIGYICLIVASVVLIFALFAPDAGTSAENGGAFSLGGMIGGVVFVLLFAVLYVISFIMNIIGYINARSDDESFKTALVFLIVGIVFSAISLFVMNKGFGSILYSLATLSETSATIFVIVGGMQIANQLGREDVSKKGSTVLKLIIAVEAITFVISFISTFMRSSATSIIATVLILISFLLSFVKYIMYLSFLSKTKKMLMAQ